MLGCQKWFHFYVLWTHNIDTVSKNNSQSKTELIYIYVFHSRWPILLARSGFIAWKRGLSRNSIRIGTESPKLLWKVLSLYVTNITISLNIIAIVGFVRKNCPSMPSVVFEWTKPRLQTSMSFWGRIPYRLVWQKQCLFANSAKRFVASSRKLPRNQTIWRTIRITSYSSKNTNEGKQFNKYSHLWFKIWLLDGYDWKFSLKGINKAKCSISSLW